MTHFFKFLFIVFLFPLSSFAQPVEQPGAFDFPFQYQDQSYHFYPSLKNTWNEDTYMNHISLYQELENHHYIQTNSSQTKTATDSDGLHFRTTLNENSFDLTLSLNQNNELQYCVDKVTLDDQGNITAKETIKDKNTKFGAVRRNKFKTFLGTEKIETQRAGTQTTELVENCSPQERSLPSNSQIIAEQHENAQHVSENLSKNQELAYLGGEAFNISARQLLDNPELASHPSSPFSNFNINFIEDETKQDLNYPQLQLLSKEGGEKHTISFVAETVGVRKNGMYTTYREFRSSEYLNYQGFDYQFTWSQFSPERLEIEKLTPVRDANGTVVRRNPAGIYQYKLPPNFKIDLWAQDIPSWQDVPNRIKRK